MCVVYMSLVVNSLAAVFFLFRSANISDSSDEENPEPVREKPRKQKREKKCSARGEHEPAEKKVGK